MQASRLGGMRQTRRVSEMILGVEKKLLRPAFLLGVLAIFLSVPTVLGQSVKDLPPPPPPWKANQHRLQSQPSRK